MAFLENLGEIIGDLGGDRPGGSTGEETEGGGDESVDRVILTTPEGYRYYADDGEFIDDTGDKAGWRPATEDDVEWVLEKRAEIEADLAAVRLRKEALLKNMSTLERGHERRLAGLDWRYRSDVIAVGRKKLEGTKSKTAQFAHGVIKFRTSAGTNKIVDQSAAVAFVEAVRPGAVKVERSVSIKDVLKVAAETGAARPTLAHFLYSTGPSETVTIATGVDG